MSRLYLWLVLASAPVSLLSKALCDEPKELTSDVCSRCSCSAPTIDCQSKELDLDMATFAWPNWTDAVALMDHNFISHVTQYPTSGLVKLSLAHNRISKIDERAFQNLQNLEELDLNDNQLVAGQLTPGVFAGLYDLELFQPMKALRKLDLSYNKIQSLDQDLFRHLPNLEILYLRHNPIAVIDDSSRMALSTIPYIKVLDLSYTGISYLPQYFLHGSDYLKELNLEGNIFAEVPNQFVADGHNLTHINLLGNPIADAVVTT